MKERVLLGVVCGGVLLDYYVWSESLEEEVPVGRAWQHSQWIPIPGKYSRETHE